jgi:hypothetical protein
MQLASEVEKGRQGSQAFNDSIHEAIMKRFRNWSTAIFMGGKSAMLAGGVVLTLMGCGEKKPGGPTPPLTPPRPVTASTELVPVAAVFLIAHADLGKSSEWLIPSAIEIRAVARGISLA